MKNIFLNAIGHRQDSLSGDWPVARPLLTQDNATTEKPNPCHKFVIRTHNLRVLAVEGGICLRLHSHCDRLFYLLLSFLVIVVVVVVVEVW
jgi:hypothetical protein